MSKKVKLVLSGSGTRFPVFVGAINRLLEEGYEFEAVCGTSGGAIVGAGVALGLSSHEMTKMCLEVVPNMSQLIDPSLWTFLWRWGLIKGDKIEKEFLKHTKGALLKDTKIPLKVVTVNYDKADSKQPYHVFSTEDSPDICIARAVRASMSIPLVFEPVKINGDRYIDGGVGANFPLDIFGETTPVIGLNMGGDGSTGGKRNTRNLADYIMSIMNIFSAATTKEYVEDAKGAQVINLKTKHGSLNFFVTKDDVKEMIKEGYTSVDKYLKNNS